MDKLIPFFYTHDDEKVSKTAYELLVKANIPFRFMGPVVPVPHDGCPCIEYGWLKYEGISGIEKFINKWLHNQLPDPDFFK